MPQHKGEGQHKGGGQPMGGGEHKGGGQYQGGGREGGGRKGTGESPSGITKHLKGLNFPASKHDLVEHARRNHVEQNVLRVLEGFPEKEYGSMADVMREYDKAA
jgi:hypothetical protein